MKKKTGTSWYHTAHVLDCPQRVRSDSLLGPIRVFLEEAAQHVANKRGHGLIAFARQTTQSICIGLTEPQMHLFRAGLLFRFFVGYSRGPLTEFYDGPFVRS